MYISTKNGRITTVYHVEPPDGENYIKIDGVEFTGRMEDYMVINDTLVYAPVEENQDMGDAKALKLFSVNAMAQEYVSHMAKVHEVPEFEKDTWVLQAKESKAWKADPSALTPMMDTIAKQRGVPREVLMEKAYIKAMQFELLTASVAGQRQKYADMINNAESLGDLDFEVKYEVETSGNRTRPIL